MKKLRLILSITLTLILLMGCAQGPPSTEGETTVPVGTTGSTAAPPSATDPPEPKRIPKVALIISGTVDNATDGAVYDGLKILAAEYPFEFALTEEATVETVENIIRNYLGSGFNIIVCNAGIGRDATHKLAREFEDSYFVQMGSDLLDPHHNEGYYELTAPQSSFLLGVIAGYMTKNNSVGYIGAMPLSNINVKGNSFFDGALYTNQDMKLSGAYMESYFDPVKCKEITSAMIAKGADVIFSDRAGLIEGCREGGVYAVWGSTDMVEEAPDVCLATVLMNMDVVMRRAIDSWINEEMLVGYDLFNYDSALSNGDFTVKLNPELLPEEIIANYEEVFKKMENGEILVEADNRNVTERN